MEWVEPFENEFSIAETITTAPYLIIEGECRYLQKLGNTDFALTINSNIKQFFNQKNCIVYDDFDVVSFLVTDWIKIQDSLEMIFNLMTGGSVRTLKILSYLREKHILAHEFALYLYQQHKIIFINRFTYPIGNENRSSQLTVIKKLITSLNSPCHLLIVGDREYIALSSLNNCIETAKVLHPSGVVLNIHSQKYFDTWYSLNNSACTYKTTGFSLNNFKRL